MDFQTRKLDAIEFIARIKDEKIFREIECAILESKAYKTRNLRPLTEKQLIARAKKSNADIVSGNITAQDRLEDESKDW